MNLRKNLVVESFFQSFKAIKNKKLYILYPVLIDLLFILGYGFVVGFFITNIQEKAVDLIQTGKSILYSGGLLKGLLTNDQTLSIILNVIVLMVLMYIQYCIFQGITWRFAKKFVEKDVSFFSYLKKYFLVNIFWFLLFFLVQIADYARRLLVHLRGEELNVTAFYYFLLFVIMYFAFISYTLITKYKIIEAIKRSFNLGIKKIRIFLLMYLIIFILFLIINLLLILASKINFTLMIILGILLAGPAYTWARVFVNLVVGKVDK